jgi:hypothetical protein
MPDGNPTNGVACSACGNEYHGMSGLRTHLVRHCPGAHAVRLDHPVDKKKRTDPRQVSRDTLVKHRSRTPAPQKQDDDQLDGIFKSILRKEQELQRLKAHYVDLLILDQKLALERKQNQA